MNILLDTHVFLWFIAADKRLSVTARTLIASPENSIYLSAASGWEIATKFSIARLSLPDAPDKYIPQQMKLNKVEQLSVEMRHTLHTYSLPMHHRDPFDRILIAQSQLDSLPILSADPLIKQYPVTVIW